MKSVIHIFRSCMCVKLYIKKNTYNQINNLCINQSVHIINQQGINENEQNMSKYIMSFQVYFRNLNNKELLYGFFLIILCHCNCPYNKSPLFLELIIYILNVILIN